MTTPDPTDRLREAADALLDELDAADIGDQPLAGHYLQQARSRLRAALAAPAPDLLAAVEALPYESLTGEGAIGLVRERDTTVEVVGREAVLALIESRSVSASREAGLDADRLERAMQNVGHRHGASVRVYASKHGAAKVAAEYARLAASPVTEEPS